MTFNNYKAVLQRTIVVFGAIIICIRLSLIPLIDETIGMFIALLSWLIVPVTSKDFVMLSGYIRPSLSNTYSECYTGKVLKIVCDRRTIFKRWRLYMINADKKEICFLACKEINYNPEEELYLRYDKQSSYVEYIKTTSSIEEENKEFQRQNNTKRRRARKARKKALKSKNK